MITNTNQKPPNGITLALLLTLVQFIFVIFSVVILINKLNIGSNLKEIYPTIKLLMSESKPAENNKSTDLSPALPATTINEFNVLSDRAYKQFSDAKYQDELATGKEMLKIAEGDEQIALAYYIQGDALYNVGKYTEAQPLLDQSLAKNPKSGMTYALIALLYGKVQRYQDMKQISLQCTEQVKDFPRCYNNLGVAYMNLGQKQQGIQAFKEAVRLEPDNLLFTQNLQFAQR